jgi:hypothetical protein
MDRTIQNAPTQHITAQTACGSVINSVTRIRFDHGPGAVGAGCAVTAAVATSRTMSPTAGGTG